MVKATVSLAPERFDLKSVKGGFVTLRRLTWGQKLERQEMATKQVIREVEQNGNRAQRRARSRQDVNAEVDVKMLSRLTAEWEFRHCIVEHNLEDDSGAVLNFQVGTTLDLLDPRIGEEIQNLINDMNNFEDEDAEGENPEGNLKTESEATSSSP
jgi:hypothetical protein